MAKNKKGKRNNKQARNGNHISGTAVSMSEDVDPTVAIGPDDGGSGDTTCGGQISELCSEKDRDSLLMSSQQKSLNDEPNGRTSQLAESDSGCESPDSPTLKTSSMSVSRPNSASPSVDSALDERRAPEVDLVPEERNADQNQRTSPQLHKENTPTPTMEKPLTPLPGSAKYKARSSANETRDRLFDDHQSIRATVTTPPAVVTGYNQQTRTVAKRRKVPNLPTSPKKHQLEFEWSFWISDPWQPWNIALIHVKDFAYIEDFWALFNHLKPPTEVKWSYYLFKKGIRPEWECESNEAGGKWILGNIFNQDSLWQELVLMLIGGAAFDDLSNHINGIYFARKKQNLATQVTVWLDTVDRPIVDKIGDIIRSTLRTYLKCDISMEFARHTLSAMGAKKKLFKQSSHFSMRGPT